MAISTFLLSFKSIFPILTTFISNKAIIGFHLHMLHMCKAASAYVINKISIHIRKCDPTRSIENEETKPLISKALEQTLQLCDRHERIAFS